MRRAARIDANQSAIVAALRQVGCTVQSLAAVGDGCPDLLVGIGGKTLLMEIKDPAQPASKRRLTDAQLHWHALWEGGTACIVTDVEGALRAVAVARAG